MAQSHRRRFALVLVIVLLVLFFRMIGSLLLGVIVGLLLWVMTRRVYNFFLRLTRNRQGISAGLSLLTTIVLVIAPITLILMVMISDAASFARQVGVWIDSYRPQVEETLARINLEGKFDLLGFEIQLADLSDKLQEFAGSVVQFLLMILQKTAGGIASAVLLLFLALYTLFFCYLRGQQFLDWLKRMLPLSHEQSERLFSDFFATSKATLKTLGVIGAVQGSLGGLGFWVCGIPSPFFWTVLMALASVIPAVGAQIIIVPACILLMLIGKFWWGMGLLLFSLVVIANIDNLLRPYLIEKEINLHEIIVFLSTIGGIAMFGFFGFLIGPVIASLLKASIQIYAEVFGLTESRAEEALPEET